MDTAEPAQSPSVPTPQEEAIEAFWAEAKLRARLNPAPVVFGPNAGDSLRPPAWAFGATPAQADALLTLVLTGVKTATASALREYEEAGEPLPEAGALSIVLDGRGVPRALLETTQVRVVPFNQVDEAHARAEGEGDRSLSHWRREHERYFTAHAEHERGFNRDMPVVLERFAVLYPRGIRPVP